MIKRVRALTSSKARHEQGLHLLENEKLVRDAIDSGAPICDVFVEEGLSCENLPIPENAHVYTVTRSVLESITESRTPQGWAATVLTPDTTPPAQYPEGLIVVLDGVQDPGNVGAILRSADAFGAVGMLLSQTCADPFSPKSIRAAMGSTYHLPVWQADAATELTRLRGSGYTALCGHLRGIEELPPLSSRTVLVIGSEGSGVSEAVSQQCTLYRLPMFGRTESLNAAVAAGVLLYVVRAAIGRPLI